MKKLFGIAVATAAVVVIVARPAAAAAPTVEHVGPIQWSGVTVDAGVLCNFPIEWSGTQEYTRTTFYENDGTTVSMRITQGVEQDSFSANGRSLVGDPYHFTFRSLFENGVRVALYEYGNVERVHLPDGGGVFVAAGETFVTSQDVFSVDFGTNGDRAAFCSALS